MRDDLAQAVGALEATSDPQQRHAMIAELGRRTDVDAARTLIALYARVPWNDLRKEVIRALGANGHERAVLALIRIMRARNAAHTSAAATLALGSSRSPLAGECLLVELNASGHLLRREVPTALGHLVCFDAAGELTQLLSRRDALTPAVLEALVLALGRSCATVAWPALRALLEERSARAAQASNGPAPAVEQRLDDALILTAGLLGDVGAEPLLSSFPCRDDSFTSELRFGSLERIHQRKGQSLEDGLSAFLRAADESSCWEAARRLRHYAPDAVRAAIGGERALGKPWQVAIACSVVGAQPRYDARWLAETMGEIPLHLCAAFARSHMRSDALFLQSLTTVLPAQPLSELLGCVAAPSLVEWLTEQAKRPGDGDAQISAINALAAQGLMAEPGSSTWMDVSLSVRRLVRHATLSVRDRAVRALGQQGGNDPHALQMLAAMLASEPDSHGSAYSALASLGTADAAQVVWQRLEQLTPDRQDEIERALTTLALLAVAPQKPVSISHLLDRIPMRARTAFLRVLACARIPGSEPAVRAALADASQFVQLLGVFAARPNGDRAVFAQLVAIVRQVQGKGASDGRAPVTTDMRETSATDVRASAATFVVASAGNEADQVALLDHLLVADRHLLLTALRHLSLADGETGEDLASLLDRSLQRGGPARLDGEVLASCVELRDTLRASREVDATAQTTPVATQMVQLEQSDPGLTASISAYDRFSHEVKAALRNAELTFAHPELFDASVDKSTMVVEYVKSIDLLFQESFGRELAQQSQRLVSAMQSRVVELGADDETLDGQDLMRLLGCEGYFTREEFPAHKLHTVVRAIVTGRIRSDRHRVLDGLRAWAVIALLFARSFVALGNSYKPLFTMRSSDADGVARAAVSLVRLQDVRNDVAHRGTMLMIDDVARVRERSIALLNDLTRLLP